jgi:hypothetical protein
MHARVHTHTHTMSDNLHIFCLQICKLMELFVSVFYLVTLSQVHSLCTIKWETEVRDLEGCGRYGHTYFKLLS